METLFPSSGGRVLDAKSCESTVSVVPVRFACLETLFLLSKCVREVFWATKLQISETQKVRVLSSEQFGDCRKGGPHPTPLRASFTEFDEFRNCFTNTIWAHLKCVHLVSDQTFLEVNLVETYEVYSYSRIPLAWEHYFSRAEAVF